MCFNVRLPFVRTVYDQVGRGELDPCAAFLTSFIKKLPTTRLHCVLDCNFDHFLPEYANWLFTDCSKHPKLDASVAISTSMGELEINYNNWTADAIAYDNYHDTDNAYSWLCESNGRSLCRWFSFTGLETLSAAFEHAYDYNSCDPKSKPPYKADIFTAASYLVFVYFLRLNRQTHQLAHKNGHGLAQSHLFCDYGDCLFHSPPQKGSRRRR